VGISIVCGGRLSIFGKSGFSNLTHLVLVGSRRINKDIIGRNTEEETDLNR
jgi:hypothetical protein